MTADAKANPTSSAATTIPAWVTGLLKLIPDPLAAGNDAA